MTQKALVPMLSFFFFGTLQDDDLRELVLGRSTPGASIENAVLRGYRRVRLRSRAQPGIIEDPKGKVEGALARDIGLCEAARINHYEGDAYEIVLRAVELSQGGLERAWVFLSDPDISSAPGEWTLKSWRLRHKPRSIKIASAWMAQLDNAELDSLKEKWRKRCELASER